MESLNQKEKEKICNEILHVKEKIWETKELINSDLCKKCSQTYTKLFRLEQELGGLQRKLSNDHTKN